MYDLTGRFDAQHAASRQSCHVDAATRIDRIERAVNLLQAHGDALCDAMSADFGQRSLDQSRMTDIRGAIGPLKHAAKHLRRWMRPSRRSTGFPMNLLGGRARIEYQPLGVVGCISPWNFPVQLAFGPLGGIFAAGNRCMVKPSEFTPATSALMTEAVANAFDADELTIIEGDAEIGAAFSALPFDHLMFTGATSIATHILRAAATNLVPVTLELGGKSPAIVGTNADITAAADSIMAGKTMNAGQICLAPDYALVPEAAVAEFVSAAKAAVGTLYPTIKDNPDYTSVINDRHFDRLQGYLSDARAKGVEVIPINPADEDFSQQEHRRIPPTLLINPGDDTLVMADEIFGPLLPIRSYTDLGDTLGYINDRPRPLGLYYFGNDRDEQRQVLDGTISGGVTLNDVMMHIAQEDLPFGGVGASGTGSYHGFDGFRNFSHPRAIYSQSSLIARLAKTIRPPYRKAA